MEIKDVAAKEILLSPINLLHTLFVVLVPGLLVVFLLVMKHSPIVHIAESLSGSLGYKTKIAVILFFAFVIGKVIQAVVLLGAKSVSWLGVKWRGRTQKPKTPDEPVNKDQALEGRGEQTAPDVFIDKYGENEAPPDAEAINAAKATTGEKVPELTPSQKLSRRFFSSFAMGVLMSKESRALDPWEAGRARAGFSICCGLVLLFASLFPGDDLRIYELIGGILLTIMGISQSRDLNGLVIDLVGQAIGRIVAQHTVQENVEILQMTNKILPIITKSINPTPSEAVPVKIVEDVAERSVEKSVNSPHKHQKKRHG